MTVAGYLSNLLSRYRKECFFFCIVATFIFIWRMESLMFKSPVWKTTQQYAQLLELAEDFSPDRHEADIVGKYFTWPKADFPMSLDDVTHRQTSSFSILKYDYSKPNVMLTPGDDLQLRIVARNALGERKRFGGDYFRVVLHHTSSMTSINGKITDHADGTYTALIPIYEFGITGEANVEVVMIHPSEAVDLIRRLTATKASPGLFFYGIFSNEKLGGTTERRQCNVWLDSVENKAKPVCNFTSPRNGEPWICDHPRGPDLTCEDITRYKVERSHDACVILKNSGLFEPDVNLRVRIGKEEKVLIIPKEAYFTFAVNQKNHLLDRVECKRNLAPHFPPRPAGFHSGRRWVSAQCRSRDFSSYASQGQCLRNKVVHILGDSTIRQWYGYYTDVSIFSRILGAVRASETESFVDVWEPRSARDARYNVTINFAAHGPPLQNGGTPHSMPYISDSVDAIRGGSDVVVVITIGPHLYLYDPSVFVRRMRTIVAAVRRLLSRAPATLVMFKGPNVFTMDDFTENECCWSDWLALRFDLIARRMLRSLLPEIVYLDAWDLTTSYRRFYEGLHPPDGIIEKELSVFLSFVCNR